MSTGKPSHELGLGLAEDAEGVDQDRRVAHLVWLLSILDHRRNVRLLRAEFGTVRGYAAGVVAAIVCGMGLLAFITALVKG